MDGQTPVTDACAQSVRDGPEASTERGALLVSRSAVHPVPPFKRVSLSHVIWYKCTSVAPTLQPTRTAPLTPNLVHCAFSSQHLVPTRPLEQPPLPSQDRDPRPCQPAHRLNLARASPLLTPSLTNNNNPFSSHSSKEIHHNSNVATLPLSTSPSPRCP